MFSPALTQTITEVKEHIYLSLKKKPLIEQILDDVKEEAERRFNIFIQTNLPKLQSLKPEDPQTFLECFLLRGLIKILDKMFKERNVKLSQKDKLEIENIFENDFDKNKKDKKKDVNYKDFPKYVPRNSP